LGRLRVRTSPLAALSRNLPKPLPQSNLPPIIRYECPWIECPDHPMLQTISALHSSHAALSALNKQLQLHQDALTKHKYLESPANQALNCYYFPYYALVERYLGSAMEYTAKLDHFKRLLLDSLHQRHLVASPQCPRPPSPKEPVDVKENETVTLHSEDRMDSIHSKLREDALPHEYSTPMSSTPIECEEMYLPTIDEDKETVYSYHSYQVPAGHVLDGGPCGDRMSDTETDSDHENDTEGDGDSESESDHGLCERDDDEMVSTERVPECMDSVNAQSTNGLDVHYEVNDATALSLRHDDSEFVYSEDSESGSEQEASSTRSAFEWLETECLSTERSRGRTVRVVVGGGRSGRTLWSADCDAMRTYFESFGAVRRVRVEGDGNGDGNGESGVTVEFECKEDADQCLHYGQSTKWRGYELRVERL